MHHRCVTAALPLAADDAFAAADGGAPVRRSRAERQTIVLDTAERLFASRSSRSVGMDELVRETGLGKMTVYRLFKSKDDLVDDEVLGTFAVVADPEDVGARVRERFGGLVDRFSVYASYPAPPELWNPLLAALR